MNDENLNQNDTNSYTQNPYVQTPYGPGPYTQHFYAESMYGEPAQNTQNPEPEIPPVETSKEEKPKKKKGGIAKKIAIGMAAALVLGSVAGAACFGVNYLGNRFIPIDNNQQTTVAQNNSNQTQNAVNQNTTTITHTNVNVSATVMDVSDLVKSVITSVVAIEGTYTYTSGFNMWGNSQTYKGTISGSGIIIGTNEDELLIVTNHHVVESMDNGSIQVALYDGSEVRANVKGSKAHNDLAVIAVKLSDVPATAIYSIATLGDSTQVEVGDAAIAIGNSMGYGISVTTGIVSALNRSVTVDNTVYEHLIQTDAAINSGNSGGALFNAKGEVIGINSVKMNNTSDANVEGMGYAISISSVQDIISELSQEETKIKLSDDERGYLGITGITITDDISNSYGYPKGALIRSVADDSAAEEAGLVKNDIIVSFDGNDILTYDELYENMCYYPIGAEVEVQYYHMNNMGDYELKTTTVTLHAR